MKKFRFRLEPVLKYRNRVKNEKKQILALRNLQLKEAEQRLEQLLHEQISNTIADTARSAALIQMAALYAKRLKAEIELQHDLIDQAQQAVDHALEEYIEASREAKVLETLKDKKKQEYQEYIRKEEEKFLDELSIQRVGRRLLENQPN